MRRRCSTWPATSWGTPTTTPLRRSKGPTVRNRSRSTLIPTTPLPTLPDARGHNSGGQSSTGHRELGRPSIGPSAHAVRSGGFEPEGQKQGGSIMEVRDKLYIDGAWVP